MNEPLPFNEQNSKHLVSDGFKFIAVDEKERIVYALKVPMTPGSLVSLEWKQYQIESEIIMKMIQEEPPYELHLIANSITDEDS